MKNILLKITPKGAELVEAGDHRSVRAAYSATNPPSGGRLEIWNVAGGRQKFKSAPAKAKKAKAKSGE